MKHLAWIAMLMAASASAQPYRLWYEEPAELWSEALPIGECRVVAPWAFSEETTEIPLQLVAGEAHTVTEE